MFIRHGLRLLVLAFASISGAIESAITRFENYKTELYLDHAGAHSGDPIVASTYAVVRPSQRWNVTRIGFVDGQPIYTIVGIAAYDNIFVNAADGNGLTARPIPTPFHLRLLKPYTYSLTLPLTTLAITVPEQAGAQVTLQEFDASNTAQHWLPVNDPD